MGLLEAKDRGRPTTSEMVAAVLLTVVLVFVALVLSGVVVFASFRAAACAGQSCDLTAGQVSIYLTPAAWLVAFVLAVVLSIARGIGGRSLWPTPILGMVVVVLVFVIALSGNGSKLPPGKG